MTRSGNGARTMKQQANGVSGLEISSMPIAAIQLRCDRERSWSRCSRASSRTSASDQWLSPCGMSFQRRPALRGCALTESHIAIHTFPETGLAAMAWYCCRPRPVWAWEVHLPTSWVRGRSMSVRSREEHDSRRRATFTRYRHPHARREPAVVSRRRRRSDSRDVAALKSGGRARQTATRGRP